jgi:YgiT-type zinc finger domain-containing protein
MTGRLEGADSRCPLCGGTLMPQKKATIPFVLGETVVVVKDLPAEVCASCHEPYMTGEVTDRLTDLLSRLRSLQTEVSVICYSTFSAAA